MNLDDIFWQEGVYYEEERDQIVLYVNGQLTASQGILLGLSMAMQTPWPLVVGNFQFIYLGEY